MMFGGPVWPNPSMPQTAHVDGRNCIGPSAPADDGPTLAPSPLSICPIAASTVQDSPRQYLAADSWNSCRYVDGSPDLPGGEERGWVTPDRTAGICCWRRLTVRAEGPRILPTSAVSAAMDRPGALISAATLRTRPSCRETWEVTSMSTSPMPSGAAAPNRSLRLEVPVS